MRQFLISMHVLVCIFDEVQLLHSVQLHSDKHSKTGGSGGCGCDGGTYVHDCDSEGLLALFSHPFKSAQVLDCVFEDVHAAQSVQLHCGEQELVTILNVSMNVVKPLVVIVLLLVSLQLT